MNINYEHYKVFYNVAKQGSITMAAHKLYISQPAVSKSIAQLEKELGIPLFEKNGRNTTLTRFGEEFLSCAEHTLSTLDEGITTLHRNARGEGLIRIGMLRPLGIEYIPRLAAGFLKANPRQDRRLS